MKQLFFRALVVAIAIFFFPDRGSAAIYTIEAGGTTFFAINFNATANGTPEIAITAISDDPVTAQIWLLSAPTLTSNSVPINHETLSHIFLPIAALGSDITVVDGTQSILFGIGASNHFSITLDIPDALQPGVIVGVPEPSTWAMMLLGFAGLMLYANRPYKKPVSNIAI